MLFSENDRTAFARAYVLGNPPIRPWVRYWARYFDLGIAGTLNLILFGSLYSNVIEQKFIWLGSSLVILLFMEAWLFTTIGTTPGKWLLKIEVRTENWGKLSFSSALLRTWLVVFNGMGLLIPIVSLITTWIAYSNLKEKGCTSWDNKLKLNIIHEKIGFTRTCSFIVLYFAMMVIAIRLISFYSHN